MSSEAPPAWSSQWTVGRLCLDTCVVIGRSAPDSFDAREQAGLEQLLDYNLDRRVFLAKTDTVDLERVYGQPNPVAAARLLQTMDLLEVFGPLVAGSSRRDHFVVSGREDDERLDHVLAIVHPGATRSGSKRHLRDAQQIATAIRYGYDGFVTTDAAIVRAGVAIRQSFGTFSIFTPTQAVAWVEEHLRRARRRRELESDRYR